LGTTKTAHIINRKYGELFPTFYISKKINEQNNINLSYSRRITRPTFNDLAPFTIFFDPKTFFAGNPALQPAIANTIQAGYGYKNYSFTISYTYEENSIDNFYFQTRLIDTTSNILYLSARNFDYAQYLTASFALPVAVNNWWSMQNNLTGDWRQINTEYDKAKIQLEIFF
jgi:outer membrane receptor protein involved in Fe transport